MGKIFVQHTNGRFYHECNICRTSIASRNDLVKLRSSNNINMFTLLFKKVINITYGEIEINSSQFIIGRYFTRKVYCKKCQSNLGWMFEFSGTISAEVEKWIVLNRNRIILCRDLVHRISNE